MARPRFGERVYRRLLRLYPRDFSEDYADEMTRLYRDRARHESTAALWLSLVVDLIRTAPKEQFAILVQDVRHAWRVWRRTPVLALVAALTLAVGVGANTAVFSVVNGLLLTPLPYPDADRLVEVFEDNSRAGGGPMEAEFPATNTNWSAWIERPQHSMFDPRVRASLLVLLGAVGAVLLIACANVANLVLARAVSRQQELALRAAIGARPARLARQLLSESVALALVSGACGLAMAFLSMDALRGLVPATLPRADEIRLDGTVLGFGLIVTTVCGLFFGVAPAMRGARTNLFVALMQGGRGGVGRSRDAWRHGLVSAQTGLATIGGAGGVAAAEPRAAAARPHRIRTGRGHDDARECAGADIPGRRAGRLPVETAGFARSTSCDPIDRSHDERAVRARRSTRRDGERSRRDRSVFGRLGNGRRTGRQRRSVSSARHPPAGGT